MKDIATTPSAAATLLASCPTPLLVLDTDGRIAAHNPALLKLTACTTDEIEGRVTAELPAVMATLVGQTGNVTWTGPNGHSHTLKIETAALEGGLEARWIHDITETSLLLEQRDQLQEELRAHTLTDEVTGLLNQRGVMLALEPQVARSRRYNSPMAVIMMEAGVEQDQERMQVAVSRLLKDQLRWADVIGCTEQGVFILVLPETSRDDALKLADKLSQRLQELPADTQAVWPCYGVTEWQKNDSAAGLLRRAGTALDQSRHEQKGMAVAL